MNKAILMGRLTRDPDVRWSQGQDQRCTARFTLAVDRRVRRDGGENQQTADFISCVAFDHTAEFIEKYVFKGMKIAVDGRISTGSYVNREGQKIYTTDVVVENAEFAESKASQERSQGGGNDAGYGNSNWQQYQQQPQEQQRRQEPQGQQGQYQNNQNRQQPPQEEYRQQELNDGFMNIPEGIEDEGLPFN